MFQLGRFKMKLVFGSISLVRRGSSVPQEQQQFQSCQEPTPTNNRLLDWPALMVSIVQLAQSAQKCNLARKILGTYLVERALESSVVQMLFALLKTTAFMV
jgi:hypothetical protein